MVSPESTELELHTTSYAPVSNPAHLFALNLSIVPVQSVMSSVVYPKKPVFTFALLPAGDDQTSGSEFGAVKLSMLFPPSVKGGLLAFTVTVYPLDEFVTTVISCAATLVLPVERVPKGMEDAVVELRFIAFPFTDPVVTAESATLNVDPTSAVIAREVVVSVAKATTVESIGVFALSFEVMRTKKDELIEVGLVRAV